MNTSFYVCLALYIIAMLASYAVGWWCDYPLLRLLAGGMFLALLAGSLWLVNAMNTDI